MRRPSSPDRSSEQYQPDSTADNSPASLPEHVDKRDYQTEGLLVNAQGGVKESRRKDGIDVPSQRLATDPLAISHSPTTAPSSLMAHQKADSTLGALGKDTAPHTMLADYNKKWRQQLRSPWSCSPCTLLTTLAAFVAMFLMAQSFLTRQLDVKGCGMSYMRPSYSRYSDFDTEHTRFASKYSLYLYREGSLDEDTRACASSRAK
jgi:glycosylphosphatidylinositol deacylase